jgi:hypothetical protein
MYRACTNIVGVDIYSYNFSSQCLSHFKSRQAARGDMSQEQFLEWLLIERVEIVLIDQPLIIQNNNGLTPLKVASLVGSGTSRGPGDLACPDLVSCIDCRRYDGP